MDVKTSTFNRYMALFAGLLLLVGLYLSSRYSYLLFHSLAEGFSIIVACGIFMVAWNSRRIMDNNYLLFLGIAYLFVGSVDFVHTLGYAGMGIFRGYDSNLPTQLWIGGRYLEGLSLLAAPLFLRRKINVNGLFLVYGALVSALFVSVFSGAFPVCFVEGEGLTAFKKGSEYVISLVLLGSLGLLYGNRERFERPVFHMVALSIAVTIAAELMFTFYISVYGLSNLIGHYLKIVSFYLIYKALIETGLRKPYSLLFRDLKRSEEALGAALKESEARSAETSALLRASRSVLEYREFHEAARAIFEYCKEVTGAAAGYVAMLSEDGSENEVLFLDPGGSPCSVDPSLPMPVRGLRGEAYWSGRTVYDNNFADSEWVKFMPEGHAPLENVLFAPLVVEGKTVGLLGLANKPGGFDENDARMASAFGKIASVALQNSRALESLENSEERFRSVAQTANDAIITADGRGDIVFWNRGAEAVFGYSQGEILGKPLSTIMPERFHNPHDRGMSRALEAGEPALAGKTVELYGLRKDGSEFPLELSLASWSTGEGIFFTGIIRDITERKRAEEALRIKNIAIESSINAIAMADLEGNLTYVNDSFLKLWGYDNDGEVLGRPAVSFWEDEAQPSEIIKVLQDKGSNIGELVAKRKDGSLFDTQLSASMVRDPDGNPLCMMGSFMDITERKGAERALRKSLEEKEMLMREIHHRVKNNFIVIYTLLKFQSKHIKDSESRGLFRESQDRVMSMSLIHEKLYRSGDLTSISFSDYLKKLAIHLFRSYSINTNTVKLRVDVPDVPVDVDMMIPCGLIVNELITNALKYAFPEGREGEVGIDVKPEGEDGYVLTVSDTGVGFPEDVDFRKTDTLGLELVAMLTKQLGGTVELDRSSGTEFRVAFKQKRFRKSGDRSQNVLN
jgi:PAS domain S-box-containing protein